MNGFVYLALTNAPVPLLRFDSACNLQEAFNTGLQSDVFAFSMYFHTDLLYVARAPLLAPVYLDCGPGVFRNLSSGACEPCPNGSVNALADTQACVACVARTEADVMRTQCVCAAGFYSAQGDEDCRPCPVGAVCGGANTIATAAGYWRPSIASNNFYTCPIAGACIGGDGSNGSRCAVGYEGVLCAVCLEGYALVAGACRRCTSTPAAVGYWILAGVVYAALLAALLYDGGKGTSGDAAPSASSPASAFSVIKSLVSFAQVVTLPTSGPVPHLVRQRLARALLRLLSLANLELLSLVSADCVAGGHVAWPVSAAATGAMPVVLIALVMAVARLPWRSVGAWLSGKICPQSDRRHFSPDPFREESADFGDKIELYARSGAPIRVAVFIVLLASPSATQALASVYTCQRVVGESYVVRDFAVACYRGIWSAMIVPVSVLFVCYAVGVPLGFFVLLRWYRQRVDLRVLHASYRDTYYWWDCLEQVRKVALLVLSAVLAPRDATTGLFGPTSLAISMAALCVHCLCRPHRTARDFWFQVRVHHVRVLLRI